jgi:hypothetical protein
MDKDSVFIPPPEAMQFELLDFAAEVAGVPFLWVVPCCPPDTCRFGHPRMQALNVPTCALNHARYVLKNSGNVPVVCACSGRIIE